MSLIASSSLMRKANHALAASAKIVRPTAKPLTIGTDWAAAKRLFQFLRRRFHPEQYHAAAPRVAGMDRRIDRGPCRPRSLRLELPPVGLDAKGIKLGQRARHGIVGKLAVLAGDDFDQQLAPHFACRIVDGAERVLLLPLQLGRVVRVIEAQALDAMVDRPFDQARSDVLREFEAERSRARFFQRFRDPHLVMGRSEERVAPVFVVNEDTEARRASRHARRRFHGKKFERTDAVAVGAGFGRKLLERRAVIDGERLQNRKIAAPGGHPVQVIERLVMAKRLVRAAVGDEELEFLEGRDLRGAEEARHRQRTAAVGPGRRRFVRFATEPPAQEPRHEGVAGAEHVVDLDREALADDPGFEVVADWPVVNDAAHGAALQHDHRLRVFADRLQRREQVAFAGGDQHFLLRPDDQVAIGEDRAKTRRHFRGGDVARVAGAVSGEAPEVRPVVDVEDDLAAVLPRDADRLLLRGRGIGLREMSAGDQHRTGRSDERRVDVVFAKRHVGDVIAVEDEREVLVVLDRQKDERRQPRRVGDDAVGIDSFASQLLADEAAHVLVADPRD